MSWRIQIPYRRLEDPVSEVAEAARELPTDEERAVVRRIVLDEIVGGQAATAGELVDKIENASPQERRELLDAARASAGLDTTEEIEFRQEFAAAQRNARAVAAVAPPARFAYNDIGLVVNLAEQEQEAERERVREESRRKLREEREAQRAQAAAEHAEHATSNRRRWSRRAATSFRGGSRDDHGRTAEARAGAADGAADQRHARARAHQGGRRRVQAARR